MDSDRLKHVVLVGPTHPYTGGIAQHTTRLALELEYRNIPVVVESWSAQYPSGLYPGPQTVPDGYPEIGVPSRVRQKLAWYDPLSWWLAGRRSRQASLVGFNIPTPFHAVPYLVFLAGRGRSRNNIGIVHNVLPHEPTPLDRTLMRLLIGRLDRVIVHGEPARREAISLGIDGGKVLERALPTPWPDAPGGSTQRAGSKARPTRLLFFGTIRAYKGLGLLLEAVARVPRVELSIAGEFWEDEMTYRTLIKELGLTARVTIHAGYVSERDFGTLFGQHDVLVMPYRSGTGSIVRELAFRFGLPVIATRTGSIADGVVNDTNGLVVEPGRVDELVRALEKASTPDTLATWQAGVLRTRRSHKRAWERYVEALINDSASALPSVDSRKGSS